MTTASPGAGAAVPPIILVGVDGGAGMAVVLRSAARLASFTGAWLLVAHVVSAPMLLADTFTPGTPGDLTDVEVSIFPDVVEALSDSTVTWQLQTLYGNPALELIRLSTEHAVSVIVVGADTPGWAGHLRRLGSGSVPARLVHEQRAPVVVIPEACGRRRRHSQPDEAVDRR